jgi:Secretion system C-terminal sorting domain
LAWPTGQLGAVISDGAGGIIVAWEDFRHSTFDDFEGYPEGSEVYLQRVDRDGNLQYGTNGKLISKSATDGWHSIGDMKPDYNGGFYIGFNRDSTAEISVLKHFDIDGQLLWKYFFPGSFIDVCATNLTGEVFINYKPVDEFSRQKLDLSGNKLWPDTLKGRIPEHKEYRAGGAFSDKNGGVIGVGAGALKIRRVDSTGQYAWNEVDLDQQQQGLIGYAPDTKGGLFVCWTECCNGNQILLKQISSNGILGEVVTNIQDEKQPVPTTIKLYQNYPNPFNNSTTLSFQIPSHEKVTLKVFNNLGKEIRTLVSKSLAPGVYSASMTLENLSSGVYYYQLKAGDQTITQKMLLIQ